MSLFDNIRQDIIDEFEVYSNTTKYYLVSSKERIFNEFTFKSNSYGNSLNNRKDCNLFKIIEEKRWPIYITCPWCGSDKTFERDDGKTHKCSSWKCKKAFTALQGTILSNTKISINIWYDIAKEFRENNKLSSCRTAKKYGITQKTAWYLIKKISETSLIWDWRFSIIDVLLAPKPFINDHYISKKISKLIAAYPEN